MTYEDGQQAFTHAIQLKLLSNMWGRDDYAGNYMYMYSQNDQDFFKNKETRRYISCKSYEEK